MPEVPSIPPSRAVFLSYAREDSEAARRIADALRAFGLEVWFDQAELRGGDTWDQKIKRQIRECALFMPLISATTQERGEGYFRREWNLGVERTRDMAAGVSFIVPIVIDETPESKALVPEEFMRYQWTRMPRGVPSPEFVSHVKRILEAPRTPAVERDAARAPAPQALGHPAPPRPKRRIPGWTWGSLAAVVVGIAVAVSVGRRSEPAPPPAVAAVTAPSAPAISEKSIAVLPFDNMSEEKDASAFFADGVHEDILTNLSFIRDLHVISRTSVMQYRGTTKAIGQIARELGVAYVLEGSVRRAGNKVRVTGQLIRASSDEHVWAKAYDRDITDVFAIQAELAQAIAAALQAAISPAEKSLLEAKPTTNTAAYDLYVKARASRNSDGTGVFDGTVESWLVDAVQLDPGFAQAWAQLGALHAYKHFNEQDASDSRLEKAKASIETAVRLAPNDPVVIEMQGDYYYYAHRDYARAAERYEHLLTLRPNSPEAFGSLGLIYRRQGRWADAEARFRRALELDPHIGRYRSSLAEQLAALHRYDDAQTEYRHMAEDNPEVLFWGYQSALVAFIARGSTREVEDFIAKVKAKPEDAPKVLEMRLEWARTTGNFAEAIRIHDRQPFFEGFDQPHWQQDIDAAWDRIGNGELATGRAQIEKMLPEAKAQASKLPLSTTVWAYLGSVEAALGHRDEALAAVRKLEELMPESADAISGPEQGRFRAIILAWAGDKDKAIEMYSKLVRTPYGTNVNIARNAADWLPIRDDPRFKAILDDPKSNAPL